VGWVSREEGLGVHDFPPVNWGERDDTRDTLGEKREAQSTPESFRARGVFLGGGEASWLERLACTGESHMGGGQKSIGAVG